MGGDPCRRGAHGRPIRTEQRRLFREQGMKHRIIRPARLRRCEVGRQRRDAQAAAAQPEHGFHRFGCTDSHGAQAEPAEERVGDGIEGVRCRPSVQPQHGKPRHPLEQRHRVLAPMEAASIGIVGDGEHPLAGCGRSRGDGRTLVLRQRAGPAHGRRIGERLISRGRARHGAARSARLAARLAA